MSRIILETRTPGQMRLDAYRAPLCGDWFRDEQGDFRIQVCVPEGTPADHSLLDDPTSLLIALHELVEVALCSLDGVSQEQVDAFDIEFERKRLAGERFPEAEPGDDPGAPYREQHRKAMLIEHLVAQFMGIRSYGEIR